MVKTDKFENVIGKGDYHVDYQVIDFSDFPQISAQVQFSLTTETVYVIYTNSSNLNTCIARFSNHTCNYFGNKINGRTASKNEILFHLGLMKREVIFQTRLFIATQQVSKKRLAEFEEIGLTIKEIYSLGANADISKYYGKRTKGENYVIYSNTIQELKDENNFEIIYKNI